jgi:hypothetical protein
MHTGYTYVAADGSSASIYAPPTLDVPDTLTLRTPLGDLKVFDRASDRELTCQDVPGVKGKCGSYECHRKQVNTCQCGRHPDGVPIRRAPRAPAP